MFSSNKIYLNKNTLDLHIYYTCDKVGMASFRNILDQRQEW